MPHSCSSQAQGSTHGPKLLRLLGFETPPHEAGLVKAIDVSSAQPRDLSALIAEYQPEHVVVKLYQKIEKIPQAYTQAQSESARRNGCTVGGYMWLYRSADPVHAVNDVLDLAVVGCRLTLPVLWIDVETYTDGTIPTAQQVEAAIAECEAQGVQPGVYTSKTMWARISNPDLHDRALLWTASYDGRATLAFEPYGGWTEAAGHQYLGSPLDLDVFRREVTE